METVKIGSTGPLVKTLQNILVKIGYRIEVDGIFGLGTKLAVKDYQEKNRLIPTGIVSKRTWDLLVK